MIPNSTNWDVADIMRQLRCMLADAARVTNQLDEFTACCCKQELYQLKCFLNDEYSKLPSFPAQEKQWEQHQLLNKLRNQK